MSTEQVQLEIARSVAAEHWRTYPAATPAHKLYAAEIENGERDGCEAVQVCLRLLRRSRDTLEQVRQMQQVAETFSGDEK